MGIPKKKKKVAKRKAKKKMAKRKKVGKKTTASKKRAHEISVLRSGVTASKWETVNQKPSITHTGESIQIRANIAVNPAAERQSEILVRISTETLVELFETHFRLDERGIGDLVLSLRKTRAAASTLLEVIRNFTWEWGHKYVKYDLDEVPSDSDIFDSRDLEKLEELKAHDWEKNT